MPPSATDEELEVTLPSAWKGVTQEGVKIPLPSGNVVRVKRTMDLVQLMTAGKIPNPLASVVTKMMNTGQIPDPESMDDGALLEMIRLIDETVVNCVTEPRVEAPPEPEPNETPEAYGVRLRAWTPKNGALALTHIDLTDRTFIFAFAQGMAGDLKSFRQEQGTAMASVADVQAAKKPTKRAAKRK